MLFYYSEGHFEMKEQQYSLCFRCHIYYSHFAAEKCDKQQKLWNFKLVHKNRTESGGMHVLYKEEREKRTAEGMDCPGM